MQFRSSLIAYPKAGVFGLEPGIAVAINGPPLHR